MKLVIDLNHKIATYRKLPKVLTKPKPLKKRKKEPAHCIHAITPPSGTSSKLLVGFDSSMRLESTRGERDLMSSAELEACDFCRSFSDGIVAMGGSMGSNLQPQDDGRED